MWKTGKQSSNVVNCKIINYLMFKECEKRNCRWSQLSNCRGSLSIEQYLSRKNDEFTFLQTHEKKILIIVSMDLLEIMSVWVFLVWWGFFVCLFYKVSGFVNMGKQ